MPESDAEPRREFIQDIDRLSVIPQAVRAELKDVTDRYQFRLNKYYERLIDWDDPNDPLRALVVPNRQELVEWGKLDASDEQAITVQRGVQHKYQDTALLLCNDTCTAYCRYCFRKRLFMPDNDEASHDVGPGLQYIAAHPEINNVVLTGGDPLVLSTRRLTEILVALREIPHVRIIRIGSKVPAFDPERISQDVQLMEAFRTNSTTQMRIYLMAHFDHPRELTDAAVKAVAMCLASGVVCANQCPLIRGVNDRPEILAELFERLSYIGCPPYYLFQCRPTAGNQPYAVPLVRSWHIFSEAISCGSGLARRARFIVTHETGKIEILEVDRSTIHCRYHEARDHRDRNRFFGVSRDDEACWLDVPPAGNDTDSHGRSS